MTDATSESIKQRRTFNDDDDDDAMNIHELRRLATTRHTSSLAALIAFVVSGPPRVVVDDIDDIDDEKYFVMQGPSPFDFEASERAWRSRQRLPTLAQLEATLNELGATFVEKRLERDVVKKRRKTPGDAYGEMTQQFISWFLENPFIGVGADDLFVDIGSGVGQLLVRVAALTGAIAVGFERDGDLARIGTQNASLAAAALKRHGLDTGRVYNVAADATVSPLPWPLPNDTWLRNVYIFINNIAFDDVLSSSIVQLLIDDEHLPNGTRIMLGEPLLWKQRDNDRIELFRRLSGDDQLGVKFYVTPVGMTTWASSLPLSPVVYTKSARNESRDFTFTFGDAYKQTMEYRRKMNLVKALVV